MITDEQKEYSGPDRRSPVNKTRRSWFEFTALILALYIVADFDNLVDRFAYLIYLING